MQLRVAIDCTSLLGPRTGVGRFTDEIVRAVATEPDIDLTAFAITWRGRDQLAGIVPHGVRTGTRPMAARPLRAAWRRVDWPPIEWWTGPVDVVHGPNYVVPPSAHGAEIVSVHDLVVVHYPELCTRDTLDFPVLIRRAVERGAWVQTVPAFVDEIVTIFGADPDRVIGIQNGVTDLAPADPAVGRRLAGGDRFVLGLGTIEPRKNFPVLVSAFDRVADDDPDVRLVVAGPDGWGADALTAAIDGARHADRIVRPGWVDDETRSSLLAAAAVFAFPSVYEGFGFPVLEAMASATPVVASATGALTDTAGVAARFVKPGDVDDLAAALDEVLRDPEHAADLVRRGTANLTRFSWAETAGQVVDLYRRAATTRM